MNITNEMISKALALYVKDKDGLRADGNKIIVENVNLKQSIELSEALMTKEKITKLQERSHTSELHATVFKAIVGVLKIIRANTKKTVVKKKKVSKVKNTNGIVFPKHKVGPKDLVYSYSKRNTFIDSPRDYFYSYLFKMNKDTYGIQPKKRKSAFFIGGVFHELLELYYTSLQLKFTPQQAYDIAKTDFNLTWTEDKKQELANQPTKEGTMLDNLMDSKAYFEHYYSYYKNNDFEEIIFAEISFLSELYKFDDEDLKDFRFLQHIKADLLVKDKGVYKLVEHKTHSRDRTVEQRVSPQTLEYVEGIQKDLGIKIHSVIFNEIRKAKPKAFKFLKKGNISTAKKSLSNFSRVMLDQQYSNGLITEEQFRDGLECVNMDYYFHREERRVITQAQKNFSMEMKYSTKSLAKALVREHKNELAGKKSNPWEYPVNWTTNKKFASDFQSLYLAFFGGAEQTAIDEIIREDFEPKKSYGNNIETPLQRINRLSSLRKG